jgi:hypothetical protein
MMKMILMAIFKFVGRSLELVYTMPYYSQLTPFLPTLKGYEPHVKLYRLLTIILISAQNLHLTHTLILTLNLSIFLSNSVLLLKYTVDFFVSTTCISVTALT